MTATVLLDLKSIYSPNWVEQLESAADIASIRAVLNDHHVTAFPATLSGVHQALTVALRVALLICDSIDDLIMDQATAAFHDALAYRPCLHGTEAGFQIHVQSVLSDLTSMIDVSTEYLLRLGLFADYAALIVSKLVSASAFGAETDDLVIHRCLMACSALSEVYATARQSSLIAEEYDLAPCPPRYRKDDVKDDIVQSASGPILGNHQIMTLNFPLCAHADMIPKLAFTSYRDNFCWFEDWATADRGDGDTPKLVSSVITLNKSFETLFAKHPTYNCPWRARNKIGTELTRWLAKLDHTTKDSSNAYLTHTGILCTSHAWVRKLMVASISYGTYGNWPVPFELAMDDYAEVVCTYIGAMWRGWSVDHDVEASIGEHNAMNWLCRACAMATTRDAFSPANAKAIRKDYILRLAWSPQSYFYFGLRHHGFERRVDNLLETSTRLSSPHRCLVQQVAPVYSPIMSGDNVCTIVTKLLGMCGMRVVSDFGDLGDKDWACHPRICSTCDFANSRSQLFMVSVGAARLATPSAFDCFQHSKPEYYANALVCLDGWRM
ncbi:hypothetical protein BO79DRAFT_155522 [Aspergillus costaricaensis CBS 115574]|uniref:Uncharacterized protein n=1 Tax=Aspergillus costaricaensis CBS 115574 TaxID=1448317 RepID=A0ACD1I582_9EURO|nr:hypothetical protein BO79DRAFT_155522 [Aspergillus costaricaensis CBS 115574]RAK85659.1 hypothetical protein BO79DRAFT_155522 [Aspergillus costaricaensis CBS 115574]